MKYVKHYLSGFVLLMSLSTSGQEVRIDAVVPNAETPAATRTQSDNSFPFLSADQSRRIVPRRVVSPFADKNTCLVNHACYCDGYLDWNQKCLSTESCRSNSQTEGKYCQYWCDNWTKCSTLSEWQCGQGSC